MFPSLRAKVESETKGEAEVNAADATEQASSVTSNVVQQATQAGSSAEEQASQEVSSAEEEVSDAAEGAGEDASDAAQDASDVYVATSLTHLCELDAEVQMLYSSKYQYCLCLFLSQNENA